MIASASGCRAVTRVDAVHEGLPPFLSPEDNEAGWRMSLAKLARLVEGGRAETWPMTARASR